MKVKIGDRNGTGEMSRGGAAGMGGERSMGGKGAHLRDLGWPAGRGSSQGRAGRWRRVDDEQNRRRASRGRAGDEQGRSRGGAGPAGRRSSGGMDLARRGGPAAGTTKSYAGTSEWRRAPF